MSLCRERSATALGCSVSAAVVALSLSHCGGHLASDGLGAQDGGADVDTDVADAKADATGDRDALGTDTGCMSPQTFCAGSCVDTRNDPSNCGSCGVQCVASPLLTCVAGVCGCSPGETRCGAQCVDIQSDASNCGRCGEVCPVAGQSCQAGNCVCPMMMPDACGATCTDESSDPSNCGACGNACSGQTPDCRSGACVAAPLVLASGQAAPQAIAIDDNNVYWANDGDGTVLQVAKSGLGQPIAIATGLNGPGSLAVDATWVYWTVSNEIQRAPIGGGAVQTDSKVVAYSLAMHQGVLVGGSIGEVYTVPTWNAQATFLAFPSCDIFSVATDATNVYWTCDGADGVSSVPFSGGSVTPLAGPVHPADFGLAVDSSNVYWIDSLNGTISAVPIGGGSVTTVVSSQAGPQALSVDSGNIYWAKGKPPGAVYKTPVMGGQQTVIASGLGSPAATAVDNTYVYWTDPGNGTVMKAQK
jgi:hypothetical protein